MHTEEHTQRDTHTGTPQNRHTHHNYSKKKKEAKNLRGRGTGGVARWCLGGTRGRKGKGKFCNPI